MRKLTLSLLTAAAVALPAGALLSGCGAGKAAGVDVAAAATKTAQKGTAKYTLDMRISGMGLPQALPFKASGVTALAEPRMTMEIDISSVLALTGSKDSAGTIGLLLDGADLHVKVPELEGVQLPGGKRWAKLDLRAVARALGVDGDALSVLFTVDPATQLRSIKAAKGMKEVGKEKVGGVNTTHFKGTFRLSDFVAALPAKQRAAVRAALKKLDRFDGDGPSLDEPAATDLWVDDAGVLRRMRQSSKLPGQGGAPGGTILVDYRLSDFGAALDTRPPAAGDVYDATEALSGLLKQGGVAG